MFTTAAGDDLVVALENGSVYYSKQLNHFSLTKNGQAFPTPIHLHRDHTRIANYLLRHKICATAHQSLSCPVLLPLGTSNLCRPCTNHRLESLQAETRRQRLAFERLNDESTSVVSDDKVTSEVEKYFMHQLAMGKLPIRSGRHQQEWVPLLRSPILCHAMSDSSSPSIPSSTDIGFVLVGLPKGRSFTIHAAAHDSLYIYCLQRINSSSPTGCFFWRSKSTSRVPKPTSDSRMRDRSWGAFQQTVY